MSRRVRPTALALATAALLAGCGDGDDADPTAFAKRTDAVCLELGTAVDELRERMVRSDASTGAAGLATALSRYAVAVRRSADGLAAVPTPRVDRGFRESAVAGLRRHASAVRAAATGARRGRVAPALRGEIRGGALPLIPPAVLADAPHCRTGD